MQGLSGTKSLAFDVFAEVALDSRSGHERPVTSRRNFRQENALETIADQREFLRIKL
jgi:hypothetical protein